MLCTSYHLLPSLTLMQGVGSSAQGLANAILFCLFTKQVRQRIIMQVRRCPRCTKTIRWVEMSSHEETTKFEDSCERSLVNSGSVQEPLLTVDPTRRSYTSITTWYMYSECIAVEFLYMSLPVLIHCQFIHDKLHFRICACNGILITVHCRVLSVTGTHHAVSAHVVTC